MSWSDPLTVAQQEWVQKYSRAHRILNFEGLCPADPTTRRVHSYKWVSDTVAECRFCGGVYVESSR